MLKKMLFPMGGGDDIAERIYGALLVAKWYKTHIDILTCQLDPSIVYNMKMLLRGGVLVEEFLKSAKADINEQNRKNEEIFKQICKELDIKVTDELAQGEASASFVTREGKRSRVVEIESKFYDMIVAAAPTAGKITGTFEAAVMKSGKNVVVIPRKMQKFDPKKVLISWTGTAQSSFALTSSIPLLQQANLVHCISSRTSLGDDVESNKNRLCEYLKMHGIDVSFEVIDTALVPGVALNKTAIEGGFDIIVAGRHGENGLREMVLGPTSKFFLENTEIPVFM